MKENTALNFNNAGQHKIFFQWYGRGHTHLGCEYSDRKQSSETETSFNMVCESNFWIFTDKERDLFRTNVRSQFYTQRGIHRATTVSLESEEEHKSF